MRAYAFVIAAAFVGACSSTGSQGQKELANLTGEIEKLVKELEGGKADLQKTIAEHDAIVNNTDGNFVGHYKAFGKGIETVEEDRQDIRERIQKVKDAAAPYFARWSDDNAKLTDPGLRDRDKKNMEETKARYDEIYKVGDEARNAYEPLMATLKQHQQFWSNNLNANSAAQLKGDTEKIDKSATALYGLIDKVTAAGKKYNESVAMRVAPPPPPPAEPEKK